MAGTDRATRGTKPVAKAFLDALATIPEDRQAAVSKEALALIRDTLAVRKEKVKAAKAKAKVSAAKAKPKAAARQAKPAKAAAIKAIKKKVVRRARKPAETVPDSSAD
jgi:hypothetical protein